jgi:hypothetical protein
MEIIRNLWYMFRRFKLATALNFLGLTIAFAAFFGIYPLVKRIAESKRKVMSLLIKGIALVISVAAYTASTLIFFPDELAGSPIYYYLFVPVCVLAFVLYDKCLTLFIRVYAIRLRPKIAKYL